MPLDEAIEFFAAHGGGARDPAVLWASTKPDEPALRAAVEHAVIVSGQPRAVAESAMRRVLADHPGDGSM